MRPLLDEQPDRRERLRHVAKIPLKPLPLSREVRLTNPEWSVDRS
jgi:hypothetical protein